MNEDSQRCFHCDLPVPKGVNYSVVIDDIRRPMCCPGCQAVAQAIVDNGLTDFYQYRTDNSNLSRQLVPDELANLDLYDNPAIQKNFVRDSDGHGKQASLILEGIVCAACVWLSERHVMQLPGVNRFQVNYSTHRAQVEWDDDQIKLSQILKAISEIGYRAHPLDPNRQEQLFKQERSQAIKRMAVAGFGAMQVMMLAVALYAGDYQGMEINLERFLRWVSLLIATPVLLYSSRTFFVAAWRDLKIKTLGMDVPVAIAIGSAYIASVWGTVTNSGEVYFDSVTMFTFFLLTGRYLEMTARQRAGRAAEELVKLLPAMATRIEGNDQKVVAVSELMEGDLILVKPGESIPADAIITEGSSSIDESLLTGESLPIRYKPGDKVIGGSVNIESSIQLEVKAVGQDTVLASIQRLLERAQSEKPGLAQLADKVASYFVLGILVIALSVGLYWWSLDSSDTFWIVISVLVVTCPCALSLATPTALTVATGQLTRLGMLTTRGHALETLSKVTHIIFDKTGTLTEGKLKLTEIKSLSDRDEKECLKLACSLERYSEHPIAKSFMRAYDKNDYFAAAEIENSPGRGIKGKINGQFYYLGNIEFILEQTKLNSDELSKTGVDVVFASQEKILTVFHFEDTLRPEAKQTIDNLNQLGIRTVILSGDRQHNVEHIASELGVREAIGLLSPQQKLVKLDELQSSGAVVAMVGDGINDAPVLSKAQVSIAMGQGTQIAQASADMVLLSNDLNHLVDSLRMSKRMQKIIKQNLGWALIYNIIAVPLAAAGWVAPWMAAIGMSMSSLIVVMNALRLNKMNGESIITRKDVTGVDVDRQVVSG
jgi:Cu2+-exporting ATPase